MKKTVIILLLAVCLALGAVSLPTGAYADVSYLPPVKTNLLSNGDFESGTASWDTNWAGQGSGIVNTDVHGGAAAYRFTLSESAGISQTVEIFPAYDMNIINQKDTDYTVSGWLKKGADFVNGSEPFRMIVRIVISDADTYVDLEPGENDKVTFTDGDDGYVRFSQNFTLQERYQVGTQTYKWYSMQIIFTAGNSTGSVCIDDVAMNYAEDPENGTIENLFTSAVTEDTAIGAPFCGSEYYFAGGGTDYSVDPNEAYKNEGGASLKYTANPNNEGTNIYMTIPINKFANDIYHFSFMVKGKNAATKVGAPASYPYGIYCFPWLRGEGAGDTRFPERLTYVTGDGDWSYRPFVNGINQNGGSVVVTTEVRDFDWTKVSIQFNPHAFVSEARGENGKTYSGDDIVDFALIIYTMGLQGEYWFDSFKMYRDGTSEPDFTTDFSLTADRVERGYLGEELELPAPTAKCLVGTETVDISDSVTLTVTDPEGTVLKNGVAATPENLRLKTDKEGYYSVRFYVSQDGRERILEYDFPVAERDVTAPVITVDAKDIAGQTGTPVKIPAAKGSDEQEGDLTSYIKVAIQDKDGKTVMSRRQANVENAFVFDAAGEYTAVYTLEDSSANQAEQVTVRIIVAEAEKGCGSALGTGSFAAVFAAAAACAAAALLIRRRERNGKK